MLCWYIQEGFILEEEGYGQTASKQRNLLGDGGYILQNLALEIDVLYRVEKDHGDFVELQYSQQLFGNSPL